MFLDKRLLLTLLATGALAAPGCSDSVVPSGDDSERGGSASSRPTTASSEPEHAAARNASAFAAPDGGADAGGATLPAHEYKLPPEQYNDVLKVRMTELWAHVYAPPTLEKDKRYPLLVFLHGNHRSCGHDSNPRHDNNDQYTLDGKCPNGSVVAPSHLGYGYIADDLAARGYIVVSINANRGITGVLDNNGDYLQGDDDDTAMILARGRLILKHLAKLSEWDRGISATPDTVGVDLKGHLDFAQVGMLGHSRGGEGIRAAYNLYRDTGSVWPAQIVTPVHFTGLFEIGPTDGYVVKNGDSGPSRLLDPNDTRWAVILPMCDGDIADLAGKFPFDRVQAMATETKPGFKSTLAVWGTNHNFYNTEWQTTESTGCVGDHNDPRFATSVTPGVSGSETQKLVGKILATTFFRANVGAARDATLNALFDPKSALPTSVTSVTRVDRGFLPSPDPSVSPQLENFTKASGTSALGQPNDASHVTVVHQAVPEHDASLQGALVTWDAGPGPTYFQINIDPPGAGVPLTDYASLDFRVDRADDAVRNTSATTNFTVQLVASTGALSASQSISSFLNLAGPVGSNAAGKHSVLQTAHIPMASFLAPLDSVRGIRFTFDPTTSGAIYLANIRVTKSGTAGTGPSSFVAQAGRVAPSGPAVVTLRGARPAPTTIVSARVASLTRRTATRGATTKDVDAIDVEVASPIPFPLGDALPILRVGSLEFVPSRVPDQDDLRRLTFTLPAASHRTLRGGEDMTVHCGSTQWNLGRLDRSILAR